MLSAEARKAKTLKKRIEQWVKCSLLPPVAASVIRGVAQSMRCETRGQEAVDALYREGRHIILAFWHAQQLMIPIGYRGAGSHVLISQHGDGEIIARIIARFGHQAVRGSSTRGGAGALRALIKLGRSGQDVVVTPDGPKGPRHVAKLGVIQLAKATGLPIVPLAFACSKKNSSRAGIATWSRIRFPVAYSSMEPLSGFRVTQTTRRLKCPALNLRRSSIG
ncbi:MAG: lysophospholipid acyltransferase family protein [Nitrospira sp.]|nr:lysophospholipid acyltransferase family protein [Nitrospira sp.]MBH0185664.1 lysophospholipid acyltransferase family protein [Nitrospira sp.]